ncbi:MAG: fluoride efflux transporter CrcB [Candidatus Omnitrophica bacterium]|nr:fluoride efflux transporter CrcB [Candidatus Omnitrophota bacterium]
MLRFFLVAAGGAIGTGCRYLLSGLDYKLSGGIFPVSTIFINLLGSFVIGILWGLFERSAISPNMRMFVFIGVLGGFTTFSTFCLENFNLIRDGELRIALWNILFSNLFGLLFVFIGFAISRYLLNMLK